ncbi:MAG: succinylglutamate desuccinylase/aspartoacylase family protein [Nitrospinaceae bacterium]|jgi:predicted deacylase|nr:succinylglutamate desuccinylase/aspartoacylase family protein [Nitrospinaceae bacterium]
MLKCSIDLKKPGKQTGFVRLAYSNNRHAYGIIPVPIATISGGAGPTLLLTAGNHGNEYEGMIALRNILTETKVKDVGGRIIFMPALNLPAVLADERVSPLDGGNMNRAFPGDPSGTPTAMIADFVETVLLPHSDYALDIHTGGSVCEYLPCGYIYKQGTRDHMQAKLTTAHVFGAPVTVVVSGTTTSGSLSAACERHGVIMVSTELGGGGVKKSTVNMAVNGITNVLHHIGLLEGVEKPARTKFIETPSMEEFVMSPRDGLFEPMVELGQVVSAGEIAGRIHTIANLDQEAIPVEIRTKGTIVAMRTHPVVMRGDFLCHTGRPVEEHELFGAEE